MSAVKNSSKDLEKGQLAVTELQLQALNERTPDTIQPIQQSCG